VKAVELDGVKRSRIMAGEILPNLISPLMWKPAAAHVLHRGHSRSFLLGFGQAPPAPNWGIMINENRIGLQANPWAVIVPALLIAVLTVDNTSATRSRRWRLERRESEQVNPAGRPGAGRRLMIDTQVPESTPFTGVEAASTRLVVRDLRVCLADSAIDVVSESPSRSSLAKLLGLVGESGSGKTTVALALLGHARRGSVTDGEVLVDGQDVLHSHLRRCEI